MTNHLGLVPDSAGRFNEQQAEKLRLAGYELCDCTLLLDHQPMYIITDFRPVEGNRLELPCPTM